MSRLAALFLLAAVLSGCCGEARARAERYAEINRAHAADESLPAEARAIAQDNADAWEVQAFNLGGSAPAAETQARVDGGSK